ncbi:MAG: glycosyltransferase family 1 protein [Patescibacteria group bacterium]
MMKIGVDGNEANVEKKVGVSVYALNILKYFCKIASQEIRFVIYLKNYPLLDLPKENKYFKYKIINGKFLWSQIYLPLYLFFHKNIDVYFSPAHYLPRYCPVPQVVTIHDLAYLYFPEDFTKKDLWQLKNWTDFSIKKADQIIAVSRTTKKDIVKCYGVDEGKINVVYNGFEKQFNKLKNKKLDLIEKFKLKNKKYILFVGTIQPRKNLEILIDAFDKFFQTKKDFKLIIVGKKGWLYKNIFEKVKSMNLENKIIFTGHVTDEELIWYYKNAFCFVLPSLYEGFGIPVLEAMRYDCPTIVSMTSSLPEIGGDASLYFDPKNPDDLLEKLKSLKENKELRKELISKGRQRIKDFSWEKCGKETLDVITGSITGSDPMLGSDPT